MTVALAAAPLVYYAVLGHVDISWMLARVASKHTFSFWSIAIGIGPLAVFSLLGYRGPARGFLDLVLRVWMPAAIVIYLVSASGFSAKAACAEVWMLVMPCACSAAAVVIKMASATRFENAMPV